MSEPCDRSSKQLTPEVKQPEDLGDRTVRFVASTAAQDRDDDVVRPEGIQTDHYSKNPVILFAHEHCDLPVGRAVDWQVRGGEFIVDVQFDEDDFSEMVFEKVQSGSLNAVSIGFRPLEVREEADVDGFVFEQVELLEISIVTVPSNPEATTIARAFEKRLAKEGRRNNADDRRRLVSIRKMADEMLAGDDMDEGVPGIEMLEDGTHPDEEMAADGAATKALDDPDRMELEGVVEGMQAEIESLIDTLDSEAPLTTRRRQDAAQLVGQHIDRAKRARQLLSPGDSDPSDDAPQMGRGLKQTDLPAPPDAVRENLRTGLRWHEEGFSGEGLQSSTVEWARRMAGGEAPSEDKALKMGSWFPRHLAQEGPLRDDDGDPTPRAVSIKLWGGKDAGPAYARRLYRAMEREIPEGLAELEGEPAQMKGIAKMATEFQDLPLAPRDREWGSDAAVGRWREFSGSTEEPSETYRDNFMWFDAEEPGEFGSYKLPYGDVVDGGHVAVPRAIFAVAAALQGARGGVDIPESDTVDVQIHVEQYYEKMREQFGDDSIVAPWNTEDDLDTWRERQRETLGIEADDETEVEIGDETMVELAAPEDDESASEDDDSPDALQVIGLQ